MKAQSDRSRDLSDCEDHELVQLCRTGSSAAFAAVVRRYNRRLYRAARAIVRDDGEAEDILQEAYVSAFRHLAGFRGDAALSTWLTRIVVNEALACVRRQKSNLSLENVEGSGFKPRVALFPMTPPPDPEKAAAKAEIRRLLEVAIDELPAVLRVVFVMRDVDGLSVEETAQVLGIRPETVKTRLHRARRQLRAALEQRLAGVLNDTFPFDGERCARMTRVVLGRLGLPVPDP